MKLNELLNIKYPFIQGGMANIANGILAAEVFPYSCKFI